MHTCDLCFLTFKQAELGTFEDLVRIFSRILPSFQGDQTPAVLNQMIELVPHPSMSLPSLSQGIPSCYKRMVLAWN
jgi:hypothetical protein